MRSKARLSFRQLTLCSIFEQSSFISPNLDLNYSSFLLYKKRSLWKGILLLCLELKKESGTAVLVCIWSICFHKSSRLQPYCQLQQWPSSKPQFHSQLPWWSHLTDIFKNATLVLSTFVYLMCATSNPFLFKEIVSSIVSQYILMCMFKDVFFTVNELHPCLYLCLQRSTCQAWRIKTQTTLTREMFQ